MRSDPRVWYAAYGSNMLRARFEVYLTGGPIPGATDGRVQDGSRDQSPPLADRPLAIDRHLFFAKQSRQWGDGGVAFLDPHSSPASPTLGRAWNISLAQLEDVCRQENRAADVAGIDLAVLAETGHVDLHSGNYGRLILLGQLLELPVITFTCRERLAPENPAHSSYLDVIRRGLDETWDLSPAETSMYLRRLSHPETQREQAEQ